jgi:hypothetical protein
MANKKLANILVGLLVLQFGLGILANLYSTIPSAKPYEVFSHFGFIAFHAINGVVLLVLGTVFLIHGIRGKVFKKEAIGGLGSIVVAFIFGELFVFTQKDIFSFLMAMAFIGALINYVKAAFSSTP